MSTMRISILNFLQAIGDRSGCHQMPERSFHINGYTFPVCARCTGVFFGQMLAVILLIFGVICPWYAAAALLGLMGLDWLVQHMEIRESTNVRRLVTGVCGGFGLFSLYIAAGALVYRWVAGLTKS